jgi:hypothetical protein
MVASLTEIGICFFAIGVGFLGGFVGNVSAGYYNSLIEPTKEKKKHLIGVFLVFAVAFAIIGAILI